MTVFASFSNSEPFASLPSPKAKTRAELFFWRVCRICFRFRVPNVGLASETKTTLRSPCGNCGASSTAFSSALRKSRTAAQHRVPDEIECVFDVVGSRRQRRGRESVGLFVEEDQIEMVLWRE